MALRRRLPFVAGEGYEGKEDPGDLPLTGTGTTPVDRPQHSLAPQQLLARHSRVMRDGSSMERCEQPQDSFRAIEALDAERNHGRQMSVDFPILGKNEVKALPVRQIALNVTAVLRRGVDRSVRRRERPARWLEQRWRRPQNDGTGVVLGTPEHGRLRRVQRRLDREIATPMCWPSDPLPLSRRSGSSARYSRSGTAYSGATTPSRYRVRPDRPRSRKSMALASGNCQATSKNSRFIGHAFRVCIRFPDAARRGSPHGDIR